MAKKIKGKEWYSVVAPKFFDNKTLGQTPAVDPAILVNRKIETPLINLVSDLNNYYFKVNFRVKEIKENKAFCEFSGLECLRDYISRMIRHGIDRIDSVQKLTTKDGKKVVVKSIAVTNRKIKKDTEKSLRTFIEEAVKKETEENTVEDMLVKIMDNSLKNHILKQGSKIYPLRMFEIRKLEVPLQ